MHKMMAAYLPLYLTRVAIAVFGFVPAFGFAMMARAGELVAIDIPAVKPAIVGKTFELEMSPMEAASRKSPTIADIAISPNASPPAKPSITANAPHSPQQNRARSPLKPPPIAAVPDEWWSQGSASPIAVALGAAEGTRHTDGGKNPAYYWHTDPGNAANNFGTFSWQHLSPEQMQPVVQAATAAEKRERSAQLGLAELADQVAFARIERFHSQLRDQAAAKGINLTFRELMNGLDLANQSPLAALSPMGYLDRLAQMQRSLSEPEEQILEARVWSYWHPRYNRWDAPGLGNSYETIRADQARRMAAIQAALQQYGSIEASGAVAAAIVETQSKPPEASPASGASASNSVSDSVSERATPSPMFLDFQANGSRGSSSRACSTIAASDRSPYAIDFVPCPMGGIAYAPD